MNISRPRKFLFRAGAAAVILTGSLIGGPAQAAGIAGVQVDQDIVLGGAGSAAKLIDSYYYTYNVEVNATVVFDFSGISSIAGGSVVGDGKSSCAATGGNTVTCNLPVNGPDEEGVSGMLAVVLDPTAAAADGDTGTFTYQVTTDGKVGSPGQSTVTIADGPDLVMKSPHTDELPAKPGDRISAPVDFANRGNATATGIRLSFSFTWGLVPTQYEGCEYSEQVDLHLTKVVCDLAGLTLAPGEGVKITDEDGADLGGTVAPFGGGSLRVAAWVEPMDIAAELPDPFKAKAGSGKKLKATKVAATPSTTARSVDIDESDNYAWYMWRVSNTWDRAAIGAAAQGQVGDEVEVTLGVKNVGPGALSSYGSGEPVLTFFVVMPEWAEATAVPSICSAFVKQPDGQIETVPGKTGEKLYQCTTNVYYAHVGDVAKYPFKLKVKALTGANGFAQLQDPVNDWEYTDANMSNNSAAITLNGGGTGGGLPVTGTQVTVVAGVGAALAVLGVALFMMSRRRRINLADEA